MNFFQRFLLTIYSLAVGVIALIVLIASLNLIPQYVVEDWVYMMYNDMQSASIVIALTILFIVLSIWSLSTMAKRRDPRLSGIHQQNDKGEIIVTIETLESIAAKAARRVKGVRDLKARVRSGISDASIRIGLRISVDGETSIPDIIEELQIIVKTYTEEVTGIPVENVNVVVEQPVQSAPAKGRVD